MIQWKNVCIHTISETVRLRHRRLVMYSRVWTHWLAPWSRWGAAPAARAQFAGATQRLGAPPIRAVSTT